MRSRRRRRLVGAVLAAILSVLVTACSGVGGSTPDPPPDASGVAWRAGTGPAVLESYRTTPWNTDGADDPRAVTSPDAPAATAVAFTVPGGGSRSELEPGFRSFTEGDRFFFGLAVHLADGFPVDTSDWQVIAQWKNSGDGSPPLSVKVGGGRFLLDGGAGIGKLWQRDIGPARTGERVDLVLGVRFSSDPGEAAIDVWQDGRHAVTGFHPRSGTLYPDEVSYMKVGLYRSDGIRDEGTVYYDDATIARTREAAAVLAPRS